VSLFFSYGYYRRYYSSVFKTLSQVLVGLVHNLGIDGATPRPVIQAL